VSHDTTTPQKAAGLVENPLRFLGSKVASRRCRAIAAVVSQMTRFT
jgi:hypothetical protein